MFVDVHKCLQMLNKKENTKHKPLGNILIVKFCVPFLLLNLQLNNHTLERVQATLLTSYATTALPLCTSEPTKRI